MSLFVLSVGDLLASYTGDSKSFAFSGEIFDGYYDDLRFLEPLDFSLSIMTLDDGVLVRFDHLRTRVIYEDARHDIDLSQFEREWKTQIDPLTDDDDIGLIDTRSMSIDLGPVIREEIIMACHQF